MLRIMLTNIIEKYINFINFSWKVQLFSFKPTTYNSWQKVYHWLIFIDHWSRATLYKLIVSNNDILTVITPLKG